MSAADANSAKTTLSKASLQRITNFLLVVSAALLAAVIILSAYIFWNKQQVAALKGSLLGQQQLQSELLAGQDSDHAPFPHLDPQISYVLNPAMAQSTWRTGPDKPYRVNRIGLRGTELAPAAEGVTRIALVGDSVLFGWKITDQETLARVMQDWADRRLKPGKYEFVTVAIPGWNIIDQDRFLRTHLGRIDPDYIIWSVIRNDLLDGAGVVPPGILMSWNAPQKRQQQAFQFLPPRQIYDTPAPIIVDRWLANLNRIEAFATEHAIPTSLLWWRARHRELFDYITSRASSQLPVVYVPGEFRYDEENWCVEPNDCHPTQWANKRLALGLMDELARRGVIKAPDWDAQETAIIQAFQTERGRGSSVEEQRAYLEEQTSRVPQRYGQKTGNPILFGAQDGKMGLNGAMLLRKAGPIDALDMEIATLGDRRGPPQQITVTVRSDQGLLAEQSFQLPNPSNQLRITFNGSADFGLYQVQWRFAYAECERPSVCHAARLIAATLSSPSDS